jgi:hypothetical protein
MELGLSAMNALLVLPSGLPGYVTSSCDVNGENIGASVLVSIPEFQVQLRLHDYFMGADALQ